MMKTVWLVVFIVSSLLLLGILVSQKLSWNWLRGFVLHLVLAAGLLYVVNELGVVEGLHIPLNPLTISTAVVLGVPGIFMMAGVQLIVV